MKLKILKIAGLVVLSLLTIYLIIITVLPSKVYVERSIVVKASQEKIFNYLIDLHNFQQWAYWAEIDPNTTYEYVGEEKGVGTQMNWHSDNIAMGYGSLWIIDTSPHQQIKLKIQLREFDNPADMTFNFYTEGESTRITFNFETSFSGYWKFFVPRMDDELGPQYEKGLLKIKHVMENSQDRN